MVLMKKSTAFMTILWKAKDFFLKKICSFQWSVNTLLYAYVIHFLGINYNSFDGE